MNIGSLLSNKFLSNLASVFGKTKFQSKILTGDVTSDGDISDLQFNNLVVGRKYRIGGQVNIRGTQTDNTFVGFYSDASAGGELYGSVRVAFDAANGGGSIKGSSPNFVFEASSTSLYLNAASLGPGSNIDGDGTKSETFITLEELPNHEETTDFS